MSGRQFSLVLAAVATSSLYLGCASWRERLPTPGIAHQRHERQAEAVQAFEQHRDGAQLTAALDRWAAGDVAGCEARLRALLVRRPDDANIHLRLAELLWSRGATAEAETELRQLLNVQPQLAEAHYLLGVLLAEQDRLDEARAFLARATELDPQSDIFRETHDALPAPSPTESGRHLLSAAGPSP